MLTRWPHTLREVMVRRGDTGDMYLWGIADDNTEWIVTLEGYRDQVPFMDLCMGLLTLSALACKRDTEIAPDYVPRAIPADERRYLDGDPVEA